MKNSRAWSRFCSVVVLCIALYAMGAISSARTVATSVNIVNNSSRVIHNVYLSDVNVDNWGANHLGNSTIGPGQSFALNNIACNQQQLRVIGEDQDGCFLSTVITCGESATWTITNDTPVDCDGSH
jgi:hypothetical protein